jgi:hypothetical protein
VRLDPPAALCAAAIARKRFFGIVVREHGQARLLISAPGQRAVTRHQPEPNGSSFVSAATISRSEW